MKTHTKAPFQNKSMKTYFFGLTRNDVKERKIWRAVFFCLACILPSLFTLTIIIIEAKDTENYGWLALLSITKYLLLIPIAYYLARRQAANYLDDIFELKDEVLAANFIEDIAFGNGDKRIVITNGKVLKENESSPIVMIGGPGQIMVHLGNVAVVETAQGIPKIISTNNKAWEIEGFERIREIGQHNEIGKREHAIVNLRDQFIKELNLSARTKDSIHIEVKGIKVIFSILRSQNNRCQIEERNPFTYDDEAMLSLIYDQAVITQPHEVETHIKFPWDTTVIPLIISDLEKLIQSHTLSELLASTGQKEMDEVATKENELEAMRMEITGEADVEKQGIGHLPPTFIPRSVITENFFSTAFKQKAAKLGAFVEWIDIGTWEISYKSVLEKLKEAREMSVKNAKFENEIAKKEKKLAFNQILELINKVIISNYELDGSASKLSTNEWKKLAETIRNDPELADPYLARQLYRQMIIDKTSKNKMIEILRAFHTELLVAKELINNDIKSPMDREAALKKINIALQNIGRHIYYYPGSK